MIAGGPPFRMSRDVFVRIGVLWMLATFVVFVVFFQYNEEYDDGSPAERLVSLAVSNVFVDEEDVRYDRATDVARQIARYVVYRGLRFDSGTPAVPEFSATTSGGTVYLITTTYRRPAQLADLTRLCQTLMLVRDVHWLLVEDADTKSPQLKAVLDASGIRHTHLCARTPEERGGKEMKRNAYYRGVANRNVGLQWIRQNADDGVVYFADDDNTYDIRLFDEMRYTRKVSMWPVGLCTSTGVSTPIVKDGKLIGFYAGYTTNRKFPVDIAGCGFSVKFLKERPNAIMSNGGEEDGFLISLAPFEGDEIELKAENCTKILVWHTQTKRNAPAMAIDREKFKNTNIIILRDNIV